LRQDGELIVRRAGNSVSDRGNGKCRGPEVGRWCVTWSSKETVPTTGVPVAHVSRGK
jgi:hypothetical protein